MNNNSVREPSMPYSVHIALNKLRQPIRGRAMRYIDNLVERGVENISLSDYHAAIGRAAAECEIDRQMEPDLERMARSMSDYENGRWQYIEDVIDELQGSGAE